MKRAAVAAALALLAAGLLPAQAGGVLKIGFYYSTEPSAGKVVFADGVNLIPGNNDQSTRLPGALAADALKQSDGTASRWGVTVTEEVGGSGAAMEASGYTAAVTDIFPAPTVSGLPNGVPLQGSASASVAFDGLTPGNLYRVTALVGRGNAWDSGTSVYRVGGTVRSAAVSAQSGAGASVSGSAVTATVQNGAWALMAFETVASDTALALSAEGHGSIQGVMLEDLGKAPEVLKIGFRFSDDVSADALLFTDGVNLIPGNNTQTQKIPPDGIPAARLKQADGLLPASWGVRVAEEVGGSGAAMEASGYTAAVTDIFPVPTVSGTANGVPLQGASSASVAFDGLTPGGVYRVTVLGARGNTWSGGRVTYRVGGTVRSAAVTAQSGADASVSGNAVTASTQAGAWALMTFETEVAGTELTLSAEGGNGNIQAVMLEGPGTAGSAMVWTRAGDGSWTDAANWAGYDAAPEVTAYLPDVGCAAVTVEAAEAAAKAAVCASASTVYTLRDLPDAVTVASSGCLVLADGEGSYGHTVTEGTVYVTGEEVVFSGTAGRIEAETAAAGDGSERPGVLTLTGAAAEVLLGQDCTLAGSGTVSGTLTVAPGACLAPAAGAPLTAGAVVARVPDFETVAWPYGEPAMTGRATVTVRPAGSGCLVVWETCGEGVEFVLPEGVPGTLERRTEGLWYVPPAEPGYRLRLK